MLSTSIMVLGIVLWGGALVVLTLIVIVKVHEAREWGRLTESELRKNKQKKLDEMRKRRPF